MPGAAYASQAQDPLRAALSWLQSQQQKDGGFSTGFSPGSDPSATADAVVAAVAGKVDPASWKNSGHSPIDFLASTVAAGGVKGPGQAAKVALAVKAAGLDPRSFGGEDLIAAVVAGYDSGKGLFGTGPFDSAIAILALTAVKEPLPPGAIEGLLATRLKDGSFSFNGDTTPGAGDSNTTAAVVQALVAAGARDQLAPSIDYFRASQNPDAGWTYQKPSQFGEATDANSTALVIQALVAAGQDLKTWKNPRQALLALQAPSGGFLFNASTPGENLLATVQAIPALAATEPSAPVNTSPVTGTVVVAALVALVVVLAAAALYARRRG